MARRSGTNHTLTLARLRGIMLDPARFSTDDEVLAGYLEPGTSCRDLIAAVFPRNKDDVGKVLEAARGGGFAVYTPIPWGLNPPRPGIVLDFRFMADIRSIDTRSLFLDIEPGVTWEQVLPVLAERGVRVALPASAKSPYVLESALEREVALSAARFSNRQLSTFHAILADGREYRSGSDALPNSVAHWREDGGPNISRVFTGSRNSFGIPVRGYVFLYPEPEDRKVVALGFANRRQACALARRAARSEIGTEVVVLSRAGAKHVLGEGPGLSAWSAVFGLEGPPALVKYQERRLGQLASELKLKPKACAGGLLEAFGAALGRPWYAPGLSIGFYTNFERVEELSAMFESALGEMGRPAQTLIPVKRGASVYVQHDLHAARDTDGARAAIKRLLPALSDAGAYFNDPTGPLATHIFSRQPGYFELLRSLKRLVDPGDILNSGQVVEV